MQWSKSILPKEIADKKVMDFVPQKFDLGTQAPALNYLELKAQGSDFEMNEALREQTKINLIEEEKEFDRIDELALDKLKEIQENAYKEAYDLGLEEGRQKSFDQFSAEISENLETLQHSLHSIANMKKEILAANESHLVQLMYYMASRLAMKELSQDNNKLVDVIRNAVTLSQDEEQISVQVSASQFEFVEELKRQTNRELEFLKNIKFEPNDSISAGGCIVSTNFGEVDARIEQKVEQLWSVIKDITPRVKDQLESE